MVAGQRDVVQTGSGDAVPPGGIGRAPSMRTALDSAGRRVADDRIRCVTEPHPGAHVAARGNPHFRWYRALEPAGSAAVETLLLGGSPLACDSVTAWLAAADRLGHGPHETGTAHAVESRHWLLALRRAMS